MKDPVIKWCAILVGLCLVLFAAILYICRPDSFPETNTTMTESSSIVTESVSAVKSSVQTDDRQQGTIVREGRPKFSFASSADRGPRVVTEAEALGARRMQ